MALRRHHKIGGAIVLGLVVLVFILAFFINRYWSPVLAAKVKSVVLSSSDSLYNVDFSDAELHVLKGQLIIYNITLKPDTAVFNHRKKQNIAPNNLVELHLRRLILNNIHPLQLYFHHKLNIGEIILSSPELNVSYALNHTRDTVIKDHRTPWQMISKSLKSVHIGMIYLNDVKLKYTDYSGHKVAISELKEMNLSASDLLIDSATQTDKSRLLYCKDIVTELNNYKGETPDGLYTYKVNHLKLSTLTSQLNVEGFALVPIKADAFFNKTSHTRYNINVDTLQLDHFDYLNYHKYRTVSASKVLIKGGTFSVFSNPNAIKNPAVDKTKSFPNVALGSLTTDLKVDTLLIKKYNIAYSEFNKKSRQVGSITFNNTSGSFLNITNNKAALLKNNKCTVHISTYFMNRGKLNVFFNFNLTDKDAAFSYKGDLGPMDLQVMNPATMPLAMVKITSGTLKSFNFDVNGSSNVSKGHLTLLYNDLKVKLLKPDSTYGLKSKIIETFYANLFILKHDNPDKPGEEPRTFNVTFIRPKNFPFFKTIWQTLFSGIKPSAGLDKKTVEAIATMKNNKALKKQERLKKKALKQEQKAEKKREKEAAKNKS
jgi:hypothetical protein